MAKALRVHHGIFGRVAILEMSRPLVVHAHGQAHILAKIGGADASFSVRDERVPLAQGAAVLVNGWEPHAYHHPSDDVRTLVLVMYLCPDWLAATSIGWRPSSRFRAPSQELSTTACGAVSRLSAALIFGAERDAAIDGAVLELLREVRTLEAGDASSPQASIDRRVARCVEYMRTHLDEREDFEELGSRFGLSRPHLFHLFHRTFAVTPNVYWNTLRMEYALGALHRGGQSIGAIAHDLGFNSQSNFTRFFQGIQGVPPRAYQSALAA